MQKRLARSLPGTSAHALPRKARCAFPTRQMRRQAPALQCAAVWSPNDSGEESGKEYDSWRKKVFGMKPKEPGSTVNPCKPDAIDTEWQELQMRGKNSNGGAGPASFSGRIDPASDYGLGLEDSWDLADDAYTPFPGNGGAPAPTDSMAMDQWNASPSLNMAASSELWNRVSMVYILLFGVGAFETEGIYSMRAVMNNDGLPIDTIIAFESQEDAERYAGLLEAAMSRHVPKVGPIDSKELLDFCADSGYNCRLEPSGTLLMPPEYNVGMTDWERSIRLRGGYYNVLAEEPVPSQNDEQSHSERALQQPFQAPTLMNQAGAYFPADVHELEEIKARLERLLPPDSASI
jgi:hypothetical protein